MGIELVVFREGGTGEGREGGEVSKNRVGHFPHFLLHFLLVLIQQKLDFLVQIFNVFNGKFTNILRGRGGGGREKRGEFGKWMIDNKNLNDIRHIYRYINRKVKYLKIFHFKTYLSLRPHINMRKISKSRINNSSQTLLSHPKTGGGKRVGGSGREIKTKKSVVFGEGEDEFVLEDLMGGRGGGKEGLRGN